MILKKLADEMRMEAYRSAQWCRYRYVKCDSLESLNAFFAVSLPEAEKPIPFDDCVLSSLPVVGKFVLTVNKMLHNLSWLKREYIPEYEIDDRYIVVPNRIKTESLRDMLCRNPFIDPDSVVLTSTEVTFRNVNNAKPKRLSITRI